MKRVCVGVAFIVLFFLVEVFYLGYSVAKYHLTDDYCRQAQEYRKDMERIENQYYDMIQVYQKEQKDLERVRNEYYDLIQKYLKEDEK